MVRSEGRVREEQADVLGLYRLVDSHQERPLYKQDGGENYVYYSSGGQCWLVGCLVGHRYSWLRNSSPAAPLCRYPSLLSSGWEVRTDLGQWTPAQENSITFQNIKGKPSDI